MRCNVCSLTFTVSCNLKAPRHVSNSFKGFPYQHGVEISRALFLGKFQAVWFQQTILLTDQALTLF